MTRHILNTRDTALFARFPRALVSAVYLLITRTAFERFGSTREAPSSHIVTMRWRYPQFLPVAPLFRLLPAPSSHFFFRLYDLLPGAL